ncbi:MAG: ABC transporter permease subunit [Nitrospirales bacterium]|nr:ABC transporter permease subunit [Nitrospirales bacterium]
MSRHRFWLGLFGVMGYLLWGFQAFPAVPEAGKVVIGSKNFAESRLLAEIFAQLIESRTSLVVERRFNLAGTQVCFEALRSGAIDVYPEYTGTGLITILGRHETGSARDTLNLVRREFLARWNLWWLSPLGFDNSYALAISRAQAKTLGLRTISDLAKVSADLTTGFGYEFIKRNDGLPGLAEQYGLAFNHVQGMQQTLKYQAAAAGDIDVLDVYTTDGRLRAYDFILLEDDQGFFPAYEAAALVRGETLEQVPALGTTLTLLTNAFDATVMQQLNYRLQEQGEPVELVAYEALHTLGLIEPKMLEEPMQPTRGVFEYMWNHRLSLWNRIYEHIMLAGSALFLGVLLAVPLGCFLERSRVMAEPVIRMLGVLQTIPSIALLAFMIPLFGIGIEPAVMALWLYSLFPIIRNTYSGIRDAAPHAVEASRALGMTDWQILYWVRFPLAASMIMAGVRTAAVLIVGTATLSALIGAGGLGVPIVSGLQMADTTVLLSGALPAASLALLVDGGLGYVERFVRPKGLEPRR